MIQINLVQFDWTSKFSMYIEVTLNRCNGKVTWKSQAYINNIVNEFSIGIGGTDYYYYFGKPLEYKNKIHIYLILHLMALLTLITNLL